VTATSLGLKPRSIAIVAKMGGTAIAQTPAKNKNTNTIVTESTCIKPVYSSGKAIPDTQIIGFLRPNTSDIGAADSDPTILPRGKAAIKNPVLSKEIPRLIMA
jgi:hypothetical protein